MYRPFNQLMAVLGSNQRTEDRDLPFWRERILKSILISGLVLSLLAYLPALRIAFQEGFWDLALVDSFAYLIILLCLRFEKIKFEYRTLGILALIYLLGFFIIIKMGLSSGGPAWLFSAAVLAGVLLGLRMALVALAVNAFAILAIGWFMSTGNFGSHSGLFQSMERGFAAGASFIFLNAVTAVSVSALVGGLENTTRQKELTAKKLDQERVGLIRAKVSLRNEIEERKASEAALRESELRYKLLAENVTDVIWTVDFGLRFTYVSPSVEKLLGYQADNLLAQPVVNFLAPESQTLVTQKIAYLSEKLEKSVNQPFDLQNLEIQMIRKNGVEIWTEIQNSFFLTSQGEVAGIIGVARDITKRREYEEALKESENKYRNILESIDEGYYEVDLAGNFTFVNRAVCEILGYSKEELIGLNNRDYTTDETSKKLFKIFNSAFLSGKPKRIMDYEIIKKDGDVRILELSTALIKDDAGNPVGFRGIARDVTKRNPNRYFKSKLGGLGQYYIGPFNELGILDGNSRIGVKYTRERGQAIAETMDNGVDRELFFKTIKRDEITLDALDLLSTFCPCHLVKSPIEHAALVDLFFDRNGIYGKEGEQRRNTLCLIMHLIDELKNSGGEEGWPFGHHVFRAAAYTGSLPGEVPWNVPEALDGTRAAWAVYQRNETLSLACQGIFWVALTMIMESETAFRDTSDFAGHFLKSKEVVKALGKRKGQRFPDAVREMKSRMPGLKSWENAGHEFSLTQWIEENHAGEPHERTLQCGVDALLCLAVRENGGADPYGAFEFPDGYFTYYPINLKTFRGHCAETWAGLTLQEFLGWLAHRWGLETHLHVALRKLRGNGLNTFKLQPTENGLRVADEIPAPVYTAPRFRQGLRMLRDLGAVVPTDDEQYELTELGRKLLGETVGN